MKEDKDHDELVRHLSDGETPRLLLFGPYGPYMVATGNGGEEDED